MITGKVPWSNMATNFEEAFKVIQTSSFPELPGEISRECKEFLRLCLAVSPSKRATVGKLLKHPFISKSIGQDELFFEVDIEPATLQPQKDKTNRA